MKKIISVSMLILFALTALPVALAEEATTTAATSTTTTAPSAIIKIKSSKENLTAEQLACVKTAVEKRENSLIAVLNNFYSSMKVAFEARKTELLAAWNITDNKEIKRARNEAWNKFKRTTREAIKTHRADRKGVWKIFEQEAKNCRVSERDEPKGNDFSL